jgi:hypothetical protein
MRHERGIGVVSLEQIRVAQARMRNFPSGYSEYEAQKMRAQMQRKTSAEPDQMIRDMGSTDKLVVASAAVRGMLSPPAEPKPETRREQYMRFSDAARAIFEDMKKPETQRTFAEEVARKMKGAMFENATKAEREQYPEPVLYNREKYEQVLAKANELRALIADLRYIPIELRGSINNNILTASTIFEWYHRTQELQ